MKKIALLAAAALTFAAAPSALRAGPVTGSLTLLALGITLALAAAGTLASLAAAAGALAALAYALLAPASPAAAGAALVALAYAERIARVRATKERLLHIAAALLAGALAGALTQAYTFASPGVHIVALLVAALLVALPLVIEADDPLAHRLDAFADDIAEPAKTALREAADLRRAEDPTHPGRAAARQIARTWTSLTRLAEARARLERNVLARHRTALAAPKDAPAARAAAVVARVDARILDHVTALARAQTAAHTAHAAEATLDDTALRTIDQTNETLESVTEALVDTP